MAKYRKPAFAGQIKATFGVTFDLFPMAAESLKTFGENTETAKFSNKAKIPTVYLQLLGFIILKIIFHRFRGDSYINIGIALCQHISYLTWHLAAKKKNLDVAKISFSQA